LKVIWQWDNLKFLALFAVQEKGEVPADAGPQNTYITLVWMLALICDLESKHCGFES
jgi:hypothetical protein